MPVSADGLGIVRGCSTIKLNEEPKFRQANKQCYTQGDSDVISLFQLRSKRWEMFDIFIN